MDATAVVAWATSNLPLIGALVTAAVTGGLGYVVAGSRAKSTYAAERANAMESDERAIEAKVRGSLLTLTTEREAARNAEWLKMTAELGALRAMYAADQVRLKTATDRNDELERKVAELRRSNYTYAARLRQQGGSLSATDVYQGGDP